MQKEDTKKEKPAKTVGEYWQEGWNQAIKDRIGDAPPCNACSGLGVRVYASTATWRGGIGGMALTPDVCDVCWGSGIAERPWVNLKEYEYNMYKFKEYVK